MKVESNEASMWLEGSLTHAYIFAIFMAFVSRVEVSHTHQSLRILYVTGSPRREVKSNA